MSGPLQAQSLTNTLKLPSAAWVVYDVANTVYAAVLTYIFTPYAGERFGTRGAIGLVSGAAMVLSAFSLDIFANLADRTGNDRVIVLAWEAEVLRQIAFADNHDADAGHFLEYLR